MSQLPRGRVLAALCIPLLACEARAQAKLSEPAAVSQTVDDTKITVEYSRPTMRRRSKVFGGEVHWDEVWTPGANWATTLETDKDVTIDGRPVAKGKYSVWLVVREKGDWTLVLAKEARLFHTRRPKPEQELNFPVTPRWTADTVETLTWDFPVVKPDRTVLRLRWATLSVPLRVDVQPSRTLTAEQRARVVGAWTLERASGKWSDERASAQPERTELRIRDEGGKLRARFTPALVDVPSAFDLFAAGSGVFFPIHYDRSGAPAGADTDVSLYFEFEDGKVKEVSLYGPGGTLLKGPKK